MNCLTQNFLVFVFFLCLNVIWSKNVDENLKPCFFVPPHWKVKVEKGEKWFASAQFHSYCLNVKTENNDTLCNQKCRYSSCISACHKPKILSDCLAACNTTYCKLGCKFYDSVFNKNNNRTIDETKYPSSKPILIEEHPSYEKITYNWENVGSLGPSKLTSIYLVTIRASTASEREYILGLSSLPSYVVGTDKMCLYVYIRSRFNEPTLKVAVQIYPINSNGPSNSIEAKNRNLTFLSKYKTPIPVKPIDKIFFENPFYQKRDTEDNVVWNATWNTSAIEERALGFVRKYELDFNTCRDQETNKEIYNLNVLNFGPDFKEGDSIYVINTMNDHLEKCLIKVTFAIKYGVCFLSSITSNSILYRGCETVTGFPYTCPIPTKQPTIDTKIDKVNITIAKTCKTKNIRNCISNTTAEVVERCTYCQKVHYRVNVTWVLPNISYKVNYIKLLFGKPGVFGMGLKNASSKIIPADATFYVIDFPSEDAAKSKVVGILMNANTNYSRKWHWKYDLPETTTLHIDNPISREPITHSSNGTIAIAIVVVLGFLCGAIFIFKIYRKRSTPDKDNDSNNSKISYMTRQDTQKVVVPDSWEINPHNIKIIEQIGEGSFGTVYSATICTSGLEKSNFAKQCGGVMLLSDKTKTAVKLLKEGSSDEEINDFCDEISLMKKIGYHRNIVNMIGCCTVRQPICLIVEFMYHGNLLNYLREERTKRINKLDNDLTSEIDVTSENMLSYAWQIASGMEYLASNTVVHRDLAARNILVGHDHLVKISDFGLSRQVTNEPIYIGVSKTKRLPVKWMSVEAIFHKEFTTASDVWSYGVVLFEIITLGGAPYPFINYLELCRLLKSGYRMEKPDNCPDEMYSIMCHCWNATPSQRPTFNELREHLEKIIEQSQRYFSFDIDNSKAYYNVASFKSIPSDDEEEDLFSKDCDQKVITIKPLAMIVQNNDETLVDLHPNNSEGSINRYISPQSLKTATDSEKMGSFDNPDFHFNE